MILFKILLTIFIVAFLVACGNDDSTGPDTDSSSGQGMSSSSVLSSSETQGYSSNVSSGSYSSISSGTSSSMSSSGTSSSISSGTSSSISSSGTSSVSSSSSSFSQFNPNVSYGEMTDSRDGKSYKTTTIGTQVWMAENLNYEASFGSYCYDDIGSNCDTYGRLYTWAAAMDIDAIYNTTEWTGSDANLQGICPTGWHLPSDDDWDVLLNYVIDNTSATDYTEAGSNLKAKSEWRIYSGISSSDGFGFSGLPGGDRRGYGRYTNEGYYGVWWSSTEGSSSGANIRYLYYYNDGFSRNYGDKDTAHSVRCLQDTE